MPFEAGLMVGPYRIVKKLGQGGMATVYKAYHAALDRYVAIKVLHPVFLQEPNFLERFTREARVVARLENPHIVPIYDFAEHEGQPYLVMKFIEGETLKARMKRGPVNARQGALIVRSVADALAYAHADGILHRDVKPSNIMLSKDGKVYLTDFGLARIAAAGESTLSGDMLLGTPQYISPEQAKGIKDLDRRTDIYSFGIVLYEMVVGRVPYNADTPFSIIHDHIYSPLPIPREVNPMVPEGIQRVLLKALAKEREDRFDNVEEMLNAFNAALERSNSKTAEVVETLAMSEAARLGQPGPEEIREEPREFPVEEGASALVDGISAAHSQADQGKRWIWPAVGLLIVGLALIGVVIFFNQPAVRALLSSGSSQPMEEMPAEQISEAVIRARKWAREHPEDPYAHLDMALILEEEGFPQLAVESFERAGELFMGQGKHPDAAKAFLSAVDLDGGLPGADKRLIEGLTSNMFLASTSFDNLPLLESLAMMLPDWRLIPIFEARMRLHDGDAEWALQDVERIIQENPDDPLALAVEAECYLALNHIEQAADAVARAMRRTRLTPWLEDFLRGLQEQIDSREE